MVARECGGLDRLERAPRGAFAGIPGRNGRVERCRIARIGIGHGCFVDRIGDCHFAQVHLIRGVDIGRESTAGRRLCRVECSERSILLVDPRIVGRIVCRRERRIRIRFRQRERRIG